ncbi:MAG: hypothetical protein AAGJ68_13450, partial [Pseudomonadota bacterium]
MKASNGKPGLKKPARKKAAPKAQKARMELFRGRPVLKWGLFSSFVLSLGAALAAWLYWQSLYIGMPFRSTNSMAGSRLASQSA